MAGTTSLFAWLARAHNQLNDGRHTELLADHERRGTRNPRVTWDCHGSDGGRRDPYVVLAAVPQHRGTVVTEVRFQFATADHGLVALVSGGQIGV